MHDAKSIAKMFPGLAGAVRAAEEYQRIEADCHKNGIDIESVKELAKTSWHSLASAYEVILAEKFRNKREWTFNG